MVERVVMDDRQAAFCTELFETDVRYSGVSIGYQPESPFAGGIVPMTATALPKRCDN